MQTVTEWLGQQILDNWNDIHHGARNVLEFIEKANKIFEQKIKDAHQSGFYCGNDVANNIKPQFNSAEQYYNETYSEQLKSKQY